MRNYMWLMGLIVLIAACASSVPTPVVTLTATIMSPVARHTPSVVITPSWRGITPGRSTEADVVRLLGIPERKNQITDFVIFEYPSEYEKMSYPNRILLRDGKVQLIKDQESSGKLEEILARYREREKITWAPDALARTRLFVFASHDLAVVAKNQHAPEFASVTEIWYFAPMTLEQFYEKLGDIFIPKTSPDPEDRLAEDFWVRQ